MSHTLVAATSDTVRLWDLGVHGSTARPASYQEVILGRRRGAATEDQLSGQAVRVLETAQFAAESATGAVDKISSVSWAADGATFVVGGKGACVRQYGRTGEALQDIRLGGRNERAAAMEIAAVQHYGGGNSGTAAECLFVANNTTRQVRRWDLVKREYTAVCQTHEHDIACMAVSAKRRLVASATAQGGEIALFNLLYNTRTDLRSATQRALTCIDISAGLQRAQVAVGSEDGLIQLFDATRSDTSPTKTFPHVHAAPIRGLTFGRDSAATIISVGLDNRIVVTDPRAFSNKSATTISTKAPLTCLAPACADVSLVVAGSIDGDVLLYDTRAPAAPVWTASVGTRAAVVAVQLAQQTDSDSAATNGHTEPALHRSATTTASQRAAGRASARNGYSIPDDAPPSARPSERRRIAGALATHDARPPTSSTSAATSADSRPPQHPSINRFRATLNELRRNAASARAQPRPSPYVSLTASPEPSTTSRANRLSRDDVTSAADDNNNEDGDQAHLDNMAILAKDRSYMELLSPAKTTKPQPSPARNNPPLSGGATDILAMLSRSNRKPVRKEAKEIPPPPQQSLVEKHPPSTRTKRHHDDDFDDFGASPLSRPYSGTADGGDHGQDPPRRHDVGDSMMEMFTPERKKRDISKKPDYSDSNGAHSSATATDSGGGGGLAQTLVEQLLSKQSEKEPVNTSDPAPYENILDDSPVNITRKPKSPEMHPPSTARLARRETRDPKTGFSFRADPPAVHKNSPVAAPHPRPRAAKPNSPLSLQPHTRSVETNAPLSALSAGSSASTKTDLDPKPSLRQTAAQAKDPHLSAEQPSQLPGAALGLGSVSNSVLQNMLSDALVPLREQLSSQISNLHLDMIRQCFVYQEQVQALRSECSDSRMLREEVDRLRQENEELKRYIPLYHTFDKDAGSVSGSHVPDPGRRRRGF
ncbi:hypothetical protein EV175_001550 [Coemansia sp. RSA 1933]|nr:hypothetical protein EV175_001550 [Coemansia sp. RSA 1933]